jgi:hypothetical protein
MPSQERNLVLHPDFRDMLRALSDENAEFLLIGGYAVGVHGLTRATGDIDLWVRPTPENAKRVWKALLRFKAPLSDCEEEDFNDETTVFQMGLVPYRIDIMTSIEGVDFESAWRNRVYATDEGVRVACIGLKDLITNKQAVARPKDLLDIKMFAAEERKARKKRAVSKKRPPTKRKKKKR